jgi:hypothetical protein
MHLRPEKQNKKRKLPRQMFYKTCSHYYDIAIITMLCVIFILKMGTFWESITCCRGKKTIAQDSKEETCAVD